VCVDAYAQRLERGVNTSDQSITLMDVCSTSNLHCGYTESCPTARHEGIWGERRYSSSLFLISALDGSDWSASRPGRALPPGKWPRYPLYRRLGGPQSRSGQRLEEKSPCLCRGSNLDRSVVQPVVRQYTDWATRLTHPVCLFLQSGMGLLGAQAWMPAYASILRSPRQGLDLIKNSCFPYQV
jgi:hypothetical protein